MDERRTIVTWHDPHGLCARTTLAALQSTHGVLDVSHGRMMRSGPSA